MSASRSSAYYDTLELIVRESGDLFVTRHAWKLAKAMIDSKTYVTSDKLLDGRTVQIRAIRPEDKPVLTEAMHHLSEESLYFRFFTYKDQLTDTELTYFTELDFARHVGLLATLIEADSDHPAGVGRYIMCSAQGETPTAELAFTVMQEYQGLGIATILLKHLIQIARAEGIEQFTAFVLPENRAMLKVFRKSGLPTKQILNSAGVLELTLSLK